MTIQIEKAKPSARNWGLCCIRELKKKAVVNNADTQHICAIWK